MRALVEAVVARPNICVVLRVPHVQRRDPASVRRPRRRALPHRRPASCTRRSAQRATEITGYEAVSVFHDFKYDPKTSITGCERRVGLRPPRHLRRGRPSSGARSAPRASPDFKYIDWFDDHPVEDDLTLLRWNDDVLGGEGFVDWYPFEHPQLGPVELGGWDFFRTWTNAPPALMAAEVAPHSEWAVAHPLASPQLAVQSFTARPRSATTLWRVRLVVENTGLAPDERQRRRRSSARRCDRSRSRSSSPTARRSRPATARQELGQLPGHGRARQMLAMFDGGFDPTDDRAKAEWVVHARGRARRSRSPPATPAPAPRRAEVTAPTPSMRSALTARRRRSLRRRVGSRARGRGRARVHAPMLAAGPETAARRRVVAHRGVGAGARRRARRPRVRVLRRAARRVRRGRDRGRRRTSQPDLAVRAARRGQGAPAREAARARRRRRRARSPTRGRRRGRRLGDGAHLPLRADACATSSRSAATFDATGGRACFLSGAFLGGPFAGSAGGSSTARCSTSARTSSISSTPRSARSSASARTATRTAGSACSPTTRAAR